MHYYRSSYCLLLYKHLANVQPATFAGSSAPTPCGGAPHYARQVIKQLMLLDVRIYVDSATSMYIGLDDSSLGEIPAQLPTEGHRMWVPRCGVSLLALARIAGPHKVVIKWAVHIAHETRELTLHRSNN